MDHGYQDDLLFPTTMLLVDVCFWLLIHFKLLINLEEMVYICRRQSIQIVEPCRRRQDGFSPEIAFS